MAVKKKKKNKQIKTFIAFIPEADSTYEKIIEST